MSKRSFQPRIPLNGYYDLSDYNVIKQQAQVAKQYGLSGFVIYSYYSNGKILLGKPAELLRTHEDIDIGYFFSWANHDWRRTWYGYNMEILQKQEYGNEIQIVEHYKYLSNFFCDSRYLKIDNKPVFAIYKASYIPNFSLYKKKWNELARLQGFNGVYFLQTIDSPSNSFCGEFDGAFDFEPGYTLASNKNLQYYLNRIRSILVKKFHLRMVSSIYDYNNVCSKIEKRKYFDNRRCYGVFTDWDNTPRHKYMGSFFKNSSVCRFKKQFEIQLKKAIENGSALLIINAWNEWTEGAYLEADNKNGYGLLQSIKEVLDKCSENS